MLRSEVAPLGIKVTIVEPGAFRTDWGGASMRLADVHPDYAATVGRVHDYRRQVDGLLYRARAAQVLLNIVAQRPAGAAAAWLGRGMRLAEQSARARAREASVWAGVSESTDFDHEDRMPALHLPRLSA